MLICSGDSRTARALEVILREAGYAATPVATLAAARTAVAAVPPHAAIVDLELPDGAAVELIAELRSWSSMPLIGVPAAGDEERTVLALQAGADDCIAKPVPERELLARLGKIFRRVAASESEAALRFGALEIDLAAHRAVLNGREVELTPTEFRLLRTLARNPGRSLERRELLLEVWGPAYADDAPLLRAHVANLRHKIDERTPAGWRYIRTEPGVGYRFCD